MTAAGHPQLDALQVQLRGAQSDVVDIWAGSALFMPLAIASGSIRFCLASKCSEAVILLFPEPFGPAIIVSVGIAPVTA